jgi:hypothetical protein
MGVGDDTFVKLMSSCRSAQETLDKIDREFKLGYHKAAKMAEIARWAQMWAVTNLDHDLLKSIFIRPFSYLQEAINAAIAEKGDERIMFLMNASLTVPKIRKRLVLRTRKYIHASTWEKGIIPEDFTKSSIPEDFEIQLSKVYSRT